MFDRATHMPLVFERKSSMKPVLARKLSATSTASSRSSSDSHTRPPSLASSNSSRRSNVSSFFNAFTLSKSPSNASLVQTPSRPKSYDGLAWHLPDYEKEAGIRAALTPWEAYLPYSPEPETEMKRPKEFEMSREEMDFRGIKVGSDGKYPFSSPTSPPSKRQPVVISKAIAPVIPAQYPPLPWTSTPPDNVVPYIPPPKTNVLTSAPSSPTGKVIVHPAPSRPARQRSSPSPTPSPKLSYVSVPSFGSDFAGSSYTTVDIIPPSRRSSFTDPTLEASGVSDGGVNVPNRPLPLQIPPECHDGSWSSIGSSFNDLSILSPTYAEFPAEIREEDEATAEDQWSDIEETPRFEQPSTLAAVPSRAKPTPIVPPPAHLFTSSKASNRSPRSPSFRSPSSPRRLTLCNPNRLTRRRTLGLPPLPGNTLKRYQQEVKTRARRLSIVIEAGSLSRSLEGHPFAIAEQDDFPVDVSADDDHLYL